MTWTFTQAQLCTTMWSRGWRRRMGLQIDAQMTLYADLRKIHFFAPGETGMNLSQTSEPAHAFA